MKLLIITQKVDRNDPVLGFLHGWIIALAQRFESIVVICLEQGEYDFPSNVRVLSLGKSSSAEASVGEGVWVSRIKYVINFYKYIWQERKNYDDVFVHMNQEYILLAGKLWWFLGKKVYMWRNHHAGSWLTDVAAFFCTKVFCTSKYSYTAKYKKTILMPVGVDTDLFKKDDSITRLPRSILFLGRISPVKKVHIFIEALNELKIKGVDFIASIYGDPLAGDLDYYQKLKKDIVDFDLSDQVHFYPGVPNRETVQIYNQHELFVNLSSSGMYDKTIFEAMACDCVVVVSNDNLIGLAPSNCLVRQDDINDLVVKLTHLLNSKPEELSRIKLAFGVILRDNSLVALVDGLLNNVQIKK